MSNANAKCRVCGKEFKKCRSSSNGAFNWKEVACSPECGAEYLRRVIEARTLVVKEVSEPKQATKRSKRAVSVVEETPIEGPAEETQEQAEE